MKLLLWAVMTPLFAQDYDVLIRGGRIVDGTGNPWFSGDVAIRNRRIAAVGRIESARAKRVIDARGLVVAPGFIDMHNHSDYTLITDGNGESAVRQGLTTVILGEGGSVGPVGGKQVGRANRETWSDFEGYFATLLRGGTSLNVGSYVGSSQVWTYVHGPSAGPPTPAERDAMREQVRIAMRQGALGVSSSLSGPPGAWIDTDSLVAMCEAAAESGGIYSTHMRTEGLGVFEAVQEALDIGRRAKLPVEIIHLKIAEHQLWGKMPDLIARIAQARAAGQQVQADVYPYRAGQNNLSSIVPPWAHEGGAQAMIARLKDAKLRPRLEDEILHGIKGSNWYNHYTATGGWEGMLLVSFSNPKYKRFEGKRMNEVINAVGRPPVDVLFELLSENGGSVPTVYFHHSEDDMQYALRQPWVSIGSDGTAVKTEGPLAAGNPHPRYYGTFPRVLGRYVREEKVLTLEEAVRKMTSANAAKVSQWDRGVLRPGMWADVTVFDPATVIDLATYEKPHQYPAGIEYVLVNGEVVVERGRHTGARPGMVLYGAGKAAGDRAAAQKKYNAADQQRQACWEKKDWACAERVLTGMLAVPEFKPYQANTLYNLACALSLAGKRDQAVARLKESIDAGYANYFGTRADSDFDGMRDDPGFVAQLERMPKPPAVVWDRSRTAVVPALRYPREDDPDLVKLRTLYKLDELVAGAATDLERLERLTRWAHGRWKHNGNNQPSRPDALTILKEAEEGKMFRCVEYASVIVAAARSLGLPARQLALKTHDVETRESGAGHVVAEVWLRDVKKWAFADGQWDVVPERGGAPLSGSEFATAIWEPKNQPMCRGASAESCGRYLAWVAPYLHYLDYSNARGTCVMMVPKGSPDPHIFQVRYPIGNCTYLSNPDAFNRAPEPR